ncbi:prepilin-type N-terminal cleavage/methylation domain-containing protein [Hippea alviniae]|uniref:prepilin-type N-terminal cleavage/methylation domain-containing protein n=1 Tax=Hippea alviniae TaxID=1279027 RepID=UPI0003B4F6C0|nr:prepilin-type N-terminal cleavage/methylation domain-containing protein [Hippea alviniae]
MRKKSAFTLIEMAIVLVILGLIIGIGIPMFKMLMQQNRLTKNRNAVERAKSSILGYVMTHYCIPRPVWKSVAGKNRRALPDGFGIKDAQGFDLIYDVDNSLNKIECNYGSFGSKTTFCDTINNLSTQHRLYIQSGSPYAFIVVSASLNYRFDRQNDIASTLGNNRRRTYEDPSHAYSENQDDVVDGYSIDEFVNLVKNKLGMCNSSSSGGSSSGGASAKSKLLTIASQIADKFSSYKKAPTKQELESQIDLPAGAKYKVSKNGKKSIITYDGEKATFIWGNNGLKRVIVR